MSSSSGRDDKIAATKSRFYIFGIRLPYWLWRLIYGPVRYVR